MNLSNLTHSVPLFKECQVMPVQDRVKLRMVTMVYKTLHSLTPTYIKNSIHTNLKCVLEMPGIAK